jgi:hypothetical protein
VWQKTPLKVSVPPVGTIVRIDTHPYSSNNKASYALEDFGSHEKLESQKENTTGLKTLLTFESQSLEIEDNPIRMLHD